MTLAEPKGIGMVVVHGVADQAPGETLRAVAACLNTQEPMRDETIRGTARREVGAFPIHTLATSVGGKHVTLYELYWADLSRPSRSLTGMTARFFEILARLPQHSAKELQRAPDSLVPKLMLGLLWLARVLTFGVVLPCIYAGLGALLALALLDRLATDAHLSAAIASVIVAVVVCVGLAWVLRWRTPASYERERIWMVTLTLVGVALTAAFSYFAWTAASSPIVLGVFVVAFAGIWLGLGLLLFAGVFGVKQPSADFRWNEGQVVAAAWGLVCLLSVVVWVVAMSWRATDGDGPADRDGVHAALDVLQLNFVVSCSGFSGAALLLLMAAGVGTWSGVSSWARARWRKQDRPASHWRLRAAGKTAILAHSAPLLAIVLLAIPLLSCVHYALHLGGLLQSPAPSLHWLADLHVYAGVARDTPSLLYVTGYMLRSSGTFLLLPVLLTLAVLAFAALVLLVPPFLAQPTTDQGVQATRTWIDAGIHLFSLAALLLTQIAMFLFVVGFATEVVVLTGGTPFACLSWLRDTLAPISAEIVVGLGVAVAGSASILALPGRMGQILTPVWPVLDILGDVDMYLHHESRRALTRRARAVLSHVEAQRHERLIFVAHSQGTVIATQLLRHSKLTQTAQLLTCGSPLANLYHRFFPHSFEWVERAAAPCLRVTRWVNLSAACDYVGMSVSHSVLMSHVAPFHPQAAGDLLVEPTSRGHTTYFKPSCATLATQLRSLLESDGTPIPPSEGPQLRHDG